MQPMQPMQAQLLHPTDFAKLFPFIPTITESIVETFLCRYIQLQTCTVFNMHTWNLDEFNESGGVFVNLPKSCQIEARPGLTALISPRFMGPGGQPGQPGQPGQVPGMQMRPMSVPRRGIESGPLTRYMQFIMVYIHDSYTTYMSTHHSNPHYILLFYHGLQYHSSLP
jgi:hypothetical protein